MEKLLELAKKQFDQVEIYYSESSSSEVEFTDAKLHDIKSNIQSGVALRVIKDGKLGFAYTRNLKDPQEFLQNALDSLKGKVEAEYEFPLTKDFPKLDTFDKSIEKVTEKQMVNECERVCEILQQKTDGEIIFGIDKDVGKIRIINSAGTDLTNISSSYAVGGGLIFPGGAAGITRYFSDKTYKRTPEGLINEMVELYNLSHKTVDPKAGKMKVLFMPFSIYALTWRLKTGTSGMSLYQKISPIAEKTGEKILDEKLTLIDNPLNDKFPGACSFDDEGVACKPLTLFENGVLKNFYFDLYYGKKLNRNSTGNGFRSTQWGGDSISTKPAPFLQFLTIKPGDKSLTEMIRSIDKGIILDGVMGAHSGNIPNGDYSVGVSPAFYVENGEIIGRVKDAMVAGNVYETLNNIISIENKVHQCQGGRFPAILCDDVSVATKK